MIFSWMIFHITASASTSGRLDDSIEQNRRLIGDSWTSRQRNGISGELTRSSTKEAKLQWCGPTVIKLGRMTDDRTETP